ncbi:MAG: dihydroorotate dehydrogenase-like protein, partial [Planctomycetota bacterium]|nr:dihydroorotate dehydrogenase-like protein [Planctomycetota bacterium]
LAVKIGNCFSSLPHLAQRLVEAGADGLVLFNRFLEADIDLERLQFKPDLVLSQRHEARVPIRWIAILSDEFPKTSFAATSGIHRSQGVIKLLMAGADVMMLATILLLKGPEYLKMLLSEVKAWLEENEYASVEQLKGSMSRGNCPDPSALERANYMHALINYTMEHPAPKRP